MKMRLTWENEAQWWWCSRWLCARGLWWPPIWGICGAVGRHYKTLCSSANDADVHPWVLIWSVMMMDSFSRPYLPLWWLLELTVCLAPSRQCGTGTQYKTWKRNYRSAVDSPSSSSLWSWLVTKICCGYDWVIWTKNNNTVIAIQYLLLNKIQHKPQYL